MTNIRQHFGDTASWDFSEAQGATFFFIDGSHTYEYVRNDTEKCLALAKVKGCTLTWHDCDWWHPGVVRWLAQMVKSGWPVARIPGTHIAIMDCK